MAKAKPQGEGETDNARPRPLHSASVNKIARLLNATGWAQEGASRSESDTQREAASNGVAGTHVNSAGVSSSVPASKNSEVVAVLRRALMLLRRHGWRSSHWARDAGQGITVFAAIQWAGDARPACYHAKRFLTLVAGVPFPDWEAAPFRIESEILALIRRAISVARGAAFTAPAGGWRVSSGPAKRATHSSNVVKLGRQKHA